MLEDLSHLIKKYDWVTSVEAWTVSVIHRRSPEDVLRAFGGDPDAPVGDFPFSELSGLQGDGVTGSLKFHAQVVQSGSNVVVLENNGWTGSVPEVARRCSVNGGAFVSVFWNVNAVGTMMEAVDGKVTAYFEHLYPLLPEAYPHEVRPDWAIGTSVDVEQSQAACMGLMELRTGVAVAPEWLGVSRLAYAIPDPHAMLADVEGADEP